MGDLRNHISREQMEVVRNMIWQGKSAEYLAGWKWFARHMHKDKLIVPEDRSGDFHEGAADCHTFADLLYPGVAALYHEEPQPEEPKVPEKEEPPKKKSRVKKLWRKYTAPKDMPKADNELSRFIAETGITQKKLAELMHLSASSVNQYVTGRLDPPANRIEQVRRLRKEWLKEQ